MAKILVHLTRGPADPTTAALGFLVARTALEQGHDVILFLAGDGVEILRDATLDSVEGKGTGKLREHCEAITGAGGRFYLSGMSSNARGLSEADIEGKPSEMAMPTKVVELAIDHDRVFTP